MYLVFFGGGEVDQDVVDEGNTKDIKVFAEDVVDEALEGPRGIGETKGHDKVLKRTIMSSEGSLPFLAFHNPDEIECNTEITLGKDLGSV